MGKAIGQGIREFAEGTRGWPEDDPAGASSDESGKA
jgi:hypothetical protein